MLIPWCSSLLPGSYRLGLPFLKQTPITEKTLWTLPHSVFTPVIFLVCPSWRTTSISQMRPKSHQEKSAPCHVLTTSLLFPQKLSLLFNSSQGRRVEFPWFWQLPTMTNFLQNGWFYQKGLKCCRPLIFLLFPHENSKHTAVLRSLIRKTFPPKCSEKTIHVFKE